MKLATLKNDRIDGKLLAALWRWEEPALDREPIPDFETVPVMHQGACDDFLGPHDALLDHPEEPFVSVCEAGA